MDKVDRYILHSFQIYDIDSSFFILDFLGNSFFILHSLTKLKVMVLDFGIFSFETFLGYLKVVVTSN